jgi:hypothetical protein
MMTGILKAANMNIQIKPAQYADIKPMTVAVGA